MRTRTLLVFFLTLTLSAVWLLARTPGSVAAQRRPAAAAREPFPDFGFLPPPDQYTGQVFKLSQNYPATRPPNSARPAFLKIDFRTNWYEYMMAGRAYCFEGNLEADWRVENNKVRRWYHMPWQHYGSFGREGVHGLTKEAPVAKQQLAVEQTYTNAVTWAVGFFNEFGGWTIGRVWRDHLSPDLKWGNRPHGFPTGTVICKPLFVSLPPDSVADQVPSLVNPVQWDAYITPSFGASDRQMGKVTLIQMDIAVRDDRAPLGWVFGTYQYNGEITGKTGWENLIPVGLMFGNDPTVTTDSSNPIPAETKINPEIKESIINDRKLPNGKPELPPTHLGWNGRLNGPVDNPRSSCMSCHSTAENPKLSDITPFFDKRNPPPGSPEWMLWFRNIACATPFDQGATAADYSLQLSISVQNFESWRDTQAGLFASAYGQTAGKLSAGKRVKVQGARLPGKRDVYPIVRDKAGHQ
ncbi:MAG TPA: hypothetical protein VFX96_12530 [Pyrinomonadaceae bacterium]|nr:hypothetical protein [Pyrinomonadaceae bacterium]